MRAIPYKKTFFGILVIASMASSCARKVVLEDDHRHPHMHKPHPHERPQGSNDVIIRP